MATIGKFYRVFIASPGGLVSERQAFRDALNDFNDSEALHKDAVFLPIGWEATLPGCGRPQSLINDDLLSCDYFVLLLWDRWGSPTAAGATAKFSSGIEEELDIATRSFADYKKPMRQIVILFKSVSERQLSDPGDQLKRVLEFKKNLENEKRFLFDTFDDIDSLKSKLRRSLAAWLRDHERGTVGKITETERNSEPQSPAEKMDSVPFDLATIGKASLLETDREKELAERAARGIPVAMLKYATALSARGRRTQATGLLEAVLTRDLTQADRARALRELARISQKEARFSRAQALLDEAIEVEGGRSSNSADVTISLADLATTFVLDNKYAASEETLRAAIEIVQRIPSQLTRLVVLLCNLGVYLSEEGRHTEANALATSAVTTEGAALEAHDHASVLLSRTKIALGQFQGPARDLEELRERLEQSGADPDLSSLYVWLAVVRRRQGDLEESARLLHTALHAAERRHGPESQNVAGTLTQLGVSLRLSKQFRDSEVALRRSLLIRQRFLGSSHPRFAQALLALGVLYFDQQGTAEAEELLGTARQIFGGSFGENSMPVAECDVAIARTRLNGELFYDAELLLRRSIDIMQKEFPVGHPLMIRTYRYLRTALDAQGKTEAAEAANDVIEEGLKKIDPTAVVGP